MVIIHYNVPEVVCRDFVVACVRWQQFFRISLVAVINEIRFSLFLCLVTSLNEN